MQLNRTGKALDVTVTTCVLGIAILGCVITLLPSGPRAEW